MTNDESKTLRLRPATIDDTRLIFRWQTSPGQRDHCRDPAAPTWDHHCRWMTACLNDPHRHLLIIEWRGTPAGILRLDDDERDGRPCREISILIAPDHHGRGVATLALTAAASRWSDRPIVAEILPGNDASVRAFTKAGFRPLERNWYIFPLGDHGTGS